MKVRLADCPQLRLLAWNRRNDDLIEEDEALALYERNLCYVDSAYLADKGTKTDRSPCGSSMVKAFYMFDKPHHQRIGQIFRALDSDYRFRIQIRALCLVV